MVSRTTTVGKAGRAAGGARSPPPLGHFIFRRALLAFADEPGHGIAAQRLRVTSEKDRQMFRSNPQIPVSL